MRFWEGGYGLRRNALLYHAPLRLEPCRGLGAVDNNFVLIVLVEHCAAVAVDVFQPVHDPALVVRALEDEAVLCTRVLDGPQSLLLQLVPGCGRFGKSTLLQKILTVIQEPHVRVPRHAVYLALVSVRLYRSRE